MSNARPFVVNAALTAIAIGYTNPAQSLIADKVLPKVPVAGEKFKWLEFPLAEGFTVPDTRVARRGRVARVEFSATENTASTDNYALSDEIPVDDIRTAKAQRDQRLSTYDPMNHSAAMLTNLIMLDREIRVAALMQNPANYAASRVMALSGSDKLSDPNSDAIGIIKGLIESTLIYRANTISMGFAVWSKLRTHPKLVNAVRGNVTGQGIITREEFCRLFEVKDLHVGESYVNLSRKGQALNMARTWGNSIQATYLDPMARPEGGVTFGFTAEFGSRIAGTIFNSDVGMEGGEEIRVGEKLKELIIAKDVGAIITNAI